MIKIPCDRCNSDGQVLIREGEFPTYPNEYGTCPECLGTKLKSVEMAVVEQKLEILENEMSELKDERDKLKSIVHNAINDKEIEEKCWDGWNHYMVELGEIWNEKFDHLSKQEGWALFNHDGIFQIQAIDNPEDGEGSLDYGDGEAYNLCVEKSLVGSKMHILALYLDGKESDIIYVPKVLLE